MESNEQLSLDIQVWQQAQTQVEFSVINPNEYSQELKSFLSSHPLMLNPDYGNYYSSTDYFNVRDDHLWRRDGYWLADELADMVSLPEETVIEMRVVGDRIYYLTPTAIVSLNYSGNDKIIIYTAPSGEQLGSFQADSNLLYVQSGDILRCVYHPTGELICSWTISGLDYWYVASPTELIYTVCNEELEIPIDEHSFVFDASDSSVKLYRIIEEENAVEGETTLDNFLTDTDEVELQSVYENIYAPMVEHDASFSGVINGMTVPLSGEFAPGNYLGGTACTHHANGCYLDGSCGCRVFNDRLLGSGIQCCGFAKYMYGCLFPTATVCGQSITQFTISGSSPTDAGATTANEFRNLFSTYTPGSYVRLTKKSSSTDHHYVIFVRLEQGTTAAEDKILVYHANWGNNCDINMSKFTYEDLHSRYASISGNYAPCVHPTGNLQWRDNSNGTHSQYCALCGQTVSTQAHTLQYSFLSETNHRKSCNVCGYQSDESHELTWTSISSSQHTVTCNQCNYSVTANHTLSYGSWSAVSTAGHCRGRTVSCTSCDYRYADNDYSHDHNVGAWQMVGSSAVCGQRLISCLNCSYAYYDITSHNYMESGWQNGNSSNVCQKKISTCTVCSHSYTSSMDTTHSYTYGSWVAVGTRAQCMKRTVSCTQCGYSYAQYDESHVYVGANCLKCGRDPNALRTIPPEETLVW